MKVTLFLQLVIPGILVLGCVTQNIFLMDVTLTVNQGVCNTVAGGLRGRNMFLLLIERVL